MKTIVFYRLTRVAVVVLTIAACVLAVSCKKADTHSGEVNQEAVQQIGIFDTYRLGEIVGDLTALSDEAAKHNAKSDTLTLMHLLNMRKQTTFPDFFLDTPVAGCVLTTDTAAVDSIIARYGAKFLPQNLKLAWVFKPSEHGAFYQGAEGFELIAIRERGENVFYFIGEDIIEAMIDNDRFQGFAVDLRLNDRGARAFSVLTEQNIGRSIAVVVKDKVYCYPTVQSRVDGGRFQITGNFTEDEANDLIDFIYGKK